MRAEGSEPVLSADVCWIGGDRLLLDVLLSVLSDSAHSAAYC